MNKLIKNKFFIFFLIYLFVFAAYKLSNRNKGGEIRNLSKINIDSLNRSKFEANALLTDDQKERQANLKTKYSSILKRYWGTKEFGRKSVKIAGFDMTKFENDHPSLKKGKFSNEYILIEDGFQVTIITGEREKIDVELIK